MNKAIFIQQQRQRNMAQSYGLHLIMHQTNGLYQTLNPRLGVKANPQGQGQGLGLGLQGQGQGRCQGQCQYGSLFSQNFKTQTFIEGPVMTNFILIARFSKLVINKYIKLGT